METMLSWWPVFVTVGGLLLAAGAAKASITSITSRLDTLNSTVTGLSEKFGGIDRAVASQKTQLDAHEEADLARFNQLDTRLKETHDIVVAVLNQRPRSVAPRRRAR